MPQFASIALLGSIDKVVLNSDPDILIFQSFMIICNKASAIPEYMY